MGADERADLRDAARFLAAVHPHPHPAVVVLEVAGAGEGAEVHPFADHAVADEAVVALVGVTLPHALLDLARDPAFGAEGRAADGAAQQLGAGADHARPGDHGVRADDGARADPDRAAARVEHGEGIDARPRLHRDALGMEHGGERMALAGDGAGAAAEILLDRGGVPLDEMPGPLDAACFDFDRGQREAGQVALELGAAPEAARHGLVIEPRRHEAAARDEQRGRSFGAGLEPRPGKGRGVHDQHRIAAREARGVGLRRLAPGAHHARPRLDREQRDAGGAPPALPQRGGAERERRHRQQIGERAQIAPVRILDDHQRAAHAAALGFTSSPRPPGTRR